MPRLNRRQFLQCAASALTTLGLSQLDIQRQGLRYAKSLAQSTPRKLALLVGINGYANNPLQGCMTDVDLQQELLIYRFGFNPADILLVTDKADVKPTRAGILQAFEEHLIKQAKLGDVVVFHYSGHGSQVYDPDSGFPDQLNSTFVPINREISQKGDNPNGIPSDRVVVSDIMGETLFLLMSNLKTENVTVVLDSCHSGGGKRGNLTIRAVDGGKDIDPSPMEREYQQQLISRLGITPEQVKKLRQEGIAKGVVIASAARDQLAYDQGLDLIPGSFGAAGESVIQAVERLRAKFRSLLAARLVKLTLNADSSRMNVSAKMRIVDGTGKPLDVVAQEFTVRGGSPLQ